MSQASRVLLILFSLLLTASCGYVVPTEIHLIPAGSQGDVFIVYNIPQANPLGRELGSRVFQIPPSRILITNEADTQWHVFNYYYVHEDGGREQLSYFNSSVNNTPENSADHRPFVWFERDVEGNMGVPCSIKYRQYYVGTRADLIARGTDGENADTLRFWQFVKDNREMFCGK